jgi:hypothetical protein
MTPARKIKLTWHPYTSNHELTKTTSTLFKIVKDDELKCDIAIGREHYASDEDLDMVSKQTDQLTLVMSLDVH